MRRCDCCGVIEHGKEFDETLTIFRGHLLCSWCINFWKSKEGELKRELKLVELQTGRFQ